MQGQSDALTDTTPVSQAYEYKWLVDSIIPLANPVGEDIRYDKTAGTPPTKECNLREWIATHVMGSACYGHTNLVPKFCENYIKQTNSDVLAVPVAKGSTRIEHWLPGTIGYEVLVEKATSAIQKAKEHFSVENVYFVWLQGESDALAGRTKDTYKESVVLLNDSLKKNVGIDKFGVIRVGRFAGDNRDDAIIEAQDEICQENNDFLMLTTIATELNKRTECMNPFVKGHYSAKGLEILGETAGRALGEYVKKCGRELQENYDAL